MRFIRLLAVALACAACFAPHRGLGEPAQRNPWTIPGTLRMAITIAPSSLNPLLLTTVYENDIARFCFDGLLSFTQDGTATPDLALEVPSLRNGGISADGKTIRYRL